MGYELKMLEKKGFGGGKKRGGTVGG